MKKFISYSITTYLLLFALPTFAAPNTDDPAMVAPFINTTPGPEYSGDTRLFQGIPGIERAANGRLWATWYGGGPTEGPENYVMLITSDDDGVTWSKEQLVIDPPGPVRAYDPCLWMDPTGKLWLFWAQAYEFWDGRSGVWAITTTESDKEHPVWSAPRRLCDGIMMNKPTVLNNGDWLIPASYWSLKITRDIPSKYLHDFESKWGANVVVSKDQGATWTQRGQVRMENSAFDEHMFVERTNGDLWMLSRTLYGIGQAVSHDSGETWPEQGPSGIPHTSARFFIRRLNSGNLLLVRHAPKHPEIPRFRRSYLTAYISKDEGKTWEGGLTLDERKHVSYPDGIQTKDGLIYIIYDFERTGARKILMATFMESDVMASEFASVNARQRILVHQATGKADDTTAASSVDLWKGPMLLGAHRGGGGAWPENTLYAFTEAAKKYPEILLEGDLQLSEDGHVVLIHDKTVDRTTEGTGAVKDLTLAQLKALDAAYDFSPDNGKTFPLRGKGITIPTLDELLEALPKRPFLLELKDGETITASSLEVMKKHQAENRILLASFNPERMNQVRTLAPNMATCYDMNNAMGMLQALRKGDWDAYTPAARVLSLPKKYVRIFKLTPEEIGKIRKKGIMVQVHTLNTPESIQQYIDMGVDSILTDFPERLNQVIQQNK